MNKSSNFIENNNKSSKNTIVSDNINTNIQKQSTTVSDNINTNIQKQSNTSSLKSHDNKYSKYDQI